MIMVEAWIEVTRRPRDGIDGPRTKDQGDAGVQFNLGWCMSEGKLDFKRKIEDFLSNPN